MEHAPARLINSFIYLTTAAIAVPVFQAVAGAKLFLMQASSLLIGAVALSTLITPLILIAVDKSLLPRYANCDLTPMAEISERQTAPIIIAGIGRYGQIVSRMLLAQGIAPNRFGPRRQHDRVSPVVWIPRVLRRRHTA